jgi:hypothetical protein
VALYGLYGQAEIAPLQHFADGLERLGHTVRWRNHNGWSGETEPFDAIVTYGARAQAQDLIRHYEAKNVPTVVIDHGYLKRVFVREDYGHGYFQIGMGRIGWVPTEAPSFDRLDALEISIAERPAPRPIKHALILGQVAFDAQHNKSGPDLQAMYERLAAELVAAGVKVRYRGHPMGRDVQPRGIPDDGVRSLADAIADADVVAALNSNAGLDAILAGCPAIVLMRSHYNELAYRWPTLLALIKPPPPARVRSYLKRLAYAQWTAAEMRDGLPQQFLASLGAVPA